MVSLWGHIHYLALRNPYKAKRNVLLQNEHTHTFSGWLQKNVRIIA